jgi:hypothetical protein
LWVKILKFFDADPGTRIRDEKYLDLGSGIRDGKKFGSRIRDPGWKKFGSGILDPGLPSQMSENKNLVAKFARIQRTK